MAQKKMQIGVVNITIHPHTAQDYMNLISLATKVGAVKVRGNTYAELKHPEIDDNLYYAEIYKYTDIDKNSAWYNKAKQKLATPDELEALIIPDNMAPNAGKFSLYFYPERHLIFYQAYYQNQTLSPNLVINFFERLFAHEKIKAQYGVVNVTHVPEKMLVEDLISNSSKETLRLELTRPNPDSLEEVEREVMARMNSRNVAVHKEEYKAIDDTFINMDDEMKTITRIAARNGKVTSKIKLPNGSKSIISTKNFPFSKVEYYDDKTISEVSMLKSVVTSLISTIRDWLN